MVTRRQNPKHFALEFDGVDDEGDLVGVANAFPATGFTWAGWLNIAAFENAHFLWRGDTWPAFRMNAAGGLYFRYYDPEDDTASVDLVGTDSMDTDTWYHIAFAMVPYVDRIVIQTWIDGVRQADAEGAAYGPVASTNNNTAWATLFYYTSATAYHVEGKCGPMGVWHGTLTDADVLDLYRRPKTADCISRAKEYWKLDEGTGNPVGVQGSTLSLGGPAWVIRPPQGKEEGTTSKSPTYNQRRIETDLIAEDTILTPGSISSVTDDDAVLERQTSAEVKRQHRVEAEAAPGAPDVRSYEVSDESIASVDSDGHVTWNGDAEGNVTVLAKSPWSIVRTSSRFVGVEDPVDVDTLDSWVAGSLAKAASEAVDNRLAGLDAADALEMYGSGYPESLVRNADCWVADVDTTAISPRSDYTWGTRYRGGILITPRDMLLCSHWSPGTVAGDKYDFVEMDGTIHTMTVAAVAEVAGGWGSGVDLRIATFTEDVPDGITPAKLPPADIADYLPNVGYGIPCLGLDQEEKATVRDLYRLGHATETTGFRRPTDAQRLAFYEDIVMYDSANPACMIGDFGGGSDELMVLTVWTYGGGGSGEAIHAYLDEIDTALDANGSPYDVSGSLADLSDYTNYA